MGLPSAIQAHCIASRFFHPNAKVGQGEADYPLDIVSETAPNYLSWIADLCLPYLGDRVLDVGPGHGGIARRVAPGRSVVALDPSEVCVAAMEDRFRDAPNVHVITGDLGNLHQGDRFDSIVMINVLEHIFDDGDALRHCATHLKPHGALVKYRPALNALYTVWDRKVGHYRRYSSRRLAGVVHEAGLRVDDLRYANFLAIPAWFLSGRLLKTQSVVGSGLSIWDRIGTGVSRAIESHVRVPIGLNLFCEARPTTQFPRE